MVLALPSCLLHGFFRENEPLWGPLWGVRGKKGEGGTRFCRSPPVFCMDFFRENQPLWGPLWGVRGKKGRAMRGFGAALLSFVWIFSVKISPCGAGSGAQSSASFIFRT